MLNDLYGVATGAGSEATAQGLDDFIHGFVAFQAKAPNVLAAADNDPESALANAYAALLWMFLEAPVAPQKAAPYLARAKAAPATARSDRVITAVDQWIANDIPGLLDTCAEAVRHEPRDIVMRKLGQNQHFNIGDAPGMLRIALQGAEQADDIAYTHSLIAFGYEQCHLLSKAEAAARRAMEIDPTDPWAHHAIAHVMLTEGRIDEGAAFLESVAPTWHNLNSFMSSHNWWHMALFYISQGRTDAVLKAYDTHVWGLAKDFAQDQVGAVSLLARMEFAGIDVGDRWNDVADHIAKRGVDLVSPFLTLQYLYALGRNDRPEAKPLMEAIQLRATEADRFDHAAWKDVALPAATGILAHTKGDWPVAVSELARALPRMSECGGSHAQRDLFEQIHLDALLQDGRASAAQQVLEMRRTFDPDGVPLNRMLGAAYDQTGLPDLAAEARARADRVAALHS